MSYAGVGRNEPDLLALESAYTIGLGQRQRPVRGCLVEADRKMTPIEAEAEKIFRRGIQEGGWRIVIVHGVRRSVDSNNPKAAKWDIEKWLRNPATVQLLYLGPGIHQPGYRLR